MEDEPDWYCAEVLPGDVAVDVVRETPEVLGFRPPVPGFGTEHIIVVPKQHVRSLLELDPHTGAKLLEVLQETSADVIRQHGGCQAITTMGDQQHNRHMQVHLAVGKGVARFIRHAQQPDGET
jgi:histidine triad (HIT) family protein